MDTLRLPPYQQYPKKSECFFFEGIKRIEESVLCVRMCAMCHREHHAGTGTRRHVGHGKARGTSTPLISRNPKKRPNSDRLGEDDGGVGLDDDEAEGHMWRMP